MKAISASAEVLALTVELTSEPQVEAMFKQCIDAFGTIDVIVHAAAAVAAGPAGDLEPSAWFEGFEVNVKGSYILAHHYGKAVESGTIIFLGTLGVSLTVPGMSSYSASKMALLKLAEFLAAEKPHLRVFTVHPGIVGVTETGRGAVVDALTPFAKDKGIQTGGLSLYLARQKADYLRGCFISANCEYFLVFAIPAD